MHKKEIYLIEIPRNELPLNVKEGNILKIVIDEGETNNRKDKINKLVQEVFE